MSFVHEKQPGLTCSDQQIFQRLEADLLDDVALQQAAVEHEALVRTDELYRRIGSLTLTAERTHTPTMSLFEATKRAAEGDQGSRKLLVANARTDYTERMIKAGHVMKVHQEVNAAGQIIQHGQTAEQVQENTLRYANKNPHIVSRTRAETKNAYTIEGLLRAGLLRDHYAVVVSLCPDLDDKTLDDLRFFAFTKSLVIQATTQEQEGVATESAFVAGVERDGAPRRDQDIARRFGSQFGKDWQGMDDADIISQIVLIPKIKMPNGAIDLVKMWDDLAGGTFFGQAKPRQDYLKYLEFCRHREQTFEPTVQKIVDELVMLAPYVDSPIAAVRTLDKISGKHAIDRAVTDRSIDPRVFGSRAAIELEEARFHYDRGNIAQFNQAMSGARRHNSSGSCPSGANSGGEDSLYNEDGSIKTPEQLAEERAEREEESDQYGSLHFYCQRGHRNTRPRGKLIPTCKHCGVSVACAPAKSLEKRGRANAGLGAKKIGGMIAPAFWQKFGSLSKAPNLRPSQSLALAGPH